MPWVRVANFDGEHGSINDLPPQSVPANIFTNVSNVRFDDGRVEKCAGFAALHGTPPDAPHYLLTLKDNAGLIRTFLPSTTKINQLLSGSYSDVSRTTGGAYTAGTENVWTGTVLHGVAILNNGSDAPQSWDATTSKFKNLPNWPTGYTAKAIRAVDNFLVALDVYDSTTRYPHNVLWSHPADPGDVPSSWDITDTTKDAGESPLAKTPGYVLDGLNLSGQFVIYKETSAFIMQYIGGQWIWKFGQGSLNTGLMGRNCVAEYKRKHLLLTPDPDVVLFDGGNYESTMDKRWRRDLANNISGVDYQKSFVVFISSLKEYWVCVPTTVGYPPNLAYVWKPDSNSWSKRDIPFLQSIAYDFPPLAASDTWDGDSGTWDADISSWSGFGTYGRLTLAVSPTSGKLFTVGASNTIDGTNMIACAEHDSYDFAHPDVPMSDIRIKQVSKIRPRFIANSGTIVKINVGWQMDINDNITWDGERQFTIGEDTELCFALNGRYISWKIVSDGDVAWALEALDFLIQYGGQY